MRVPVARVLNAILATMALAAVACASEQRSPAPAVETTPSVVTGSSPGAASATTPASPSVRIAAVGDIMLARDLVTLMDDHGSGYPYARVKELLSAADITIGNMEGTFTERGTAESKFYTFRAPPRHARGLADAGFDVVSLGNNHAMDFGETGLRDTLAALTAAGIRHAGAGMTEADARAPAIVEANGLRVAFLSANGVDEATFADGDDPGVARAAVTTLAADVAGAKLKADFVVVLIHAGTEYTDTPTVLQRTLAHAAIDAGATFVIGHHPHALQGIEQYAEGWIVYSLGNFVFDLDEDDLATLGPRPFETVVLSVTLAPGAAPVLSYEPVLIDPAENRPVVPSAERSASIRERFERLSAALR